MISEFIKKISLLLPSTPMNELTELYHTCYPVCNFRKGGRVCGKDCEPNKNHCAHHVTCPHLIQSGKRKGTACGKLNCTVHKGVVLCTKTSSGNPCLHTCEEGETVCKFHKKEEKLFQELSKPVYPIRIHDSGFYVIRNTLLVVDIIRQCLCGTLYNDNGIWKIDNTETEDIMYACKHYKITFYKE